MEKHNTHIVIVTYNGMRWLDRCLRSIPEQYPVIIVDNASTDDTCQYIRKHFPDYKLLEEVENLGFGQANNKGIRIALDQSATGVFLLNQDAYLEADTIRQLEKAALGAPEYGVLSPIHFNGSGDKLDRLFSNYLTYDRQPYFYGDALESRLDPIYEIAFVNAAAWYLPLHTLKTIGGFDPIFFHYGEDDNYIQRVRFHKYKVGIVPSCKIYHDREDRKKAKPKSFSEKYFKTVEKLYKVRYANVGLDDHDGVIKEQIRLLIIHSIKSLLKINLEKVSGYMKERTMLKQWAKEIKQSVSINRKKGSHYL